MSLLHSFQLSLKEACSDYRDCCGPLIITCSSLLLLICSAQCTHRWILMPRRMAVARLCVRVPHERTQTDADRRQKLEQHECTKMNMHTLALLSVRRRVRRLSLLFKSMEEEKAWYVTHMRAHKRTQRSLPWYFITAAEGWEEKRISFKWNQ